ncbi:MAG: gfo/Idh/MocA family oxidoreductase [Polaromonas sp.]|nr:gfo/Idh/MocA family oxidoreductase [Polaromonas sp.]
MASDVKGRLRVGVVGAGPGAGPHFDSLRDLADEVEVAWVCARDAAKLALANTPPGAVLTTRFEDLLEDAQLAAVLVLTPAGTHLEFASRAAAAGKHVLVEKPLEVDLDKAARLVQRCEAHGVTLAVMLQHRLSHAALALRRLLDEGKLGTLLSGSASVRWWRPQSYYDVPGRGTLARDGGGVLMTQAIHTLDLLLSLTGMPESVFAAAVTSAVHRMECEDTVAAVLSYSHGAIVSIDATTAAYPGFPERIALNYSGGSATLESGELHAELHDGGKIRGGSKSTSGSGANMMAFDHAQHRAVLQDFLRAVRTGTEPAVSGRSALDVQRLIAAMLESSARRAPVLLRP